MKFPSLVKLPRNRKFNIEPRYYDPIKEEIEERTARIKSELESDTEHEYTPGKISFERKTTSVPTGSMMQMLIAAILGSLVFGWLYFGNEVFMVLWLVVPVYLYFRLKRRNNR
jgi:hypothetical protein